MKHKIIKFTDINLVLDKYDIENLKIYYEYGDTKETEKEAERIEEAYDTFHSADPNFPSTIRSIIEQVWEQVKGVAHE